MGATVIVSVRIMHLDAPVRINNTQRIRYVIFTYPLKFFVFVFSVSTSGFLKRIKARVNQRFYLQT